MSTFVRRVASAAVSRRELTKPADRISVCFVSPTRSAAELLAGTANLHIGGAEVQITQLASRLARSGHTVSCLVPGPSSAAEEISTDGVRVIPAYELADVPGGASWLTRKWPGLWKAMSRADADVYVTRGANWHTGVTALFARLHGRSSVFWLASDSDVGAADGEEAAPLHVRMCFRYGVQRCDAIVAQTRTQQRLVAEQLGRKATVIPNMWIPSEKTAPTAARDDREVLWVGNIRARKRPELALEVAALLPDVHLTMVGGPVDGAEQLHDRVQTRAAALGNVTLTGHVPHDRIHEHYARASILLHTSMAEGFPNVFLEAWGHGLPVVSTFDPDSVIMHHGLGWVGQTGVELAARIAGLCADRRRYDTCSANALTYVRQYHYPDAVAGAVEPLLVSLVARCASQPVTWG